MSIISISSALRKGIDLTDLETLSSRELDSFDIDDYFADQDGGHGKLILFCLSRIWKIAPFGLA